MQLDPALPSQRVERFAREHGIEVLDLREVLAGHIEAGHPPLYHAFRDRHWKALGHRVAARELASFLRQRGLVPDPS